MPALRQARPDLAVLLTEAGRDLEANRAFFEPVPRSKATSGVADSGE
jgi:hypothetical protein